MAWTGDVARVHCDVISAETYVQNAIGILEAMEEEERPPGALVNLDCVMDFIQLAANCLSVGVSPEVLELLRGQVMPLERP